MSGSGLRILPLSTLEVGPDAAMRVTYDEMPRRHVHIGAPFRIEDPHSTSGTSVGGHQLSPREQCARPQRGDHHRRHDDTDLRPRGSLASKHRPVRSSSRSRTTACGARPSEPRAIGAGILR